MWATYTPSLRSKFTTCILVHILSNTFRAESNQILKTLFVTSSNPYPALSCSHLLLWCHWSVWQASKHCTWPTHTTMPPHVHHSLMSPLMSLTLDHTSNNIHSHHSPDLCNSAQYLTGPSHMLTQPWTTPAPPCHAMASTCSPPHMQTWCKHHQQPYPCQWWVPQCQ